MRLYSNFNSGSLGQLRRLAVMFALASGVTLVSACAETPVATPGSTSGGMATTEQRLKAGMVDYKDIQNYQQCVAAGFPSLRSMPPQCVLPDGRRFVKSGAPKTCVDKCGDGTCQEVVCMALGCPCSESKETCAKDCP
jgi:hypothetical protein